MLQIKIVRENPEWVKERLALKKFKELNLVDEIVNLDK